MWPQTVMTVTYEIVLDPRVYQHRQDETVERLIEALKHQKSVSQGMHRGTPDTRIPAEPGRN